MHTLGTMAVLSVALGACNTVMGAREGTMEYPGSAAGPNAVPTYVVKDKDTVDGLSRPLPQPFFVIATQNPFHQVGTFPLPESQLDRFLMCISLGYPDRDAERALLFG